MHCTNTVFVCVCACACVYLCTLLWDVQSHHVVQQELLKELHLSHTKVEVQAAAHVHLQGMTTHHRLLGEGGRGGRDTERE